MAKLQPGRRIKVLQPSHKSYTIYVMPFLHSIHIDGTTLTTAPPKMILVSLNRSQRDMQNGTKVISGWELYIPFGYSALDKDMLMLMGIWCRGR